MVKPQDFIETLKIDFSSEVIDATKAKQNPPATPSESAPLVPTPKIVRIFPKRIFPTAKDEEIPLYTSQFGKSVLRHTANARGFVGEAWTGLKNRFLARSLETSLHPDISVTDTEGLRVTITVPVSQYTGLDSTTRRVREATENLLRTGQYSRRPQLPPGENKKGKRIIPTPSAPNPDVKKIRLRNPVNLVDTRNKQLLRNSPYWPLADITFEAGDESQALKLLHDRRMADLPQETAGMLMPDLDLEIALRYLSKTDRLMETSLRFPLGQSSIQFDENGVLKEDPNEMNGLFFHPAIRSLQDFSHLISAQILQATGKAATIDPKIIYQAMLMAPKADKDTEGIIGPYIDRMRFIGAVSRLLNAYPGEFALGLCRIVNIVDRDGNPHPERTKLSTGIMANILGFKNAPHPYGSSLTYVGFVSSLNQTLNDIPDNPAFLEWAGNAKVVNMAVNRAREMKELYELVKKLGISDASQVAGEYRKTMSAAEFFGLALTPQVIGLSALTLLRIEHSQANVIKNEFLRIMHVLDALDEVVVTDTAKNQDYWESMLSEFLDKAKRINATQTGKNAARDVIKVIEKKYKAAKDNVIEIAARPSNTEKPDEIN